MASNKRIPLKAVEETVGGNDQAPQTVRLVYADIMLEALRTGGVQGLTVGEMGRRLKVIDKLERAGKEETDELIVTPEEQRTLVDVLEDFRFRVVLRSAVDMFNDIEYAPDVEEKA